MKRSQPRTVYELIAQSAQKKPNAIAVHFIRNESDLNDSYLLSYEDLLSQLNRSVDMMRKLTGKRRPVVSLLLPNIPEAQVLLWAAETAGIANPLNPLLDTNALFELMTKAETDIVFALGPEHEGGIWEKAVNVSNRLSNCTTCISVLSPSEPLNYESELFKYEDVSLTGNDAPSPEDIAAYFHTGGTTGTPKLARQTQTNQVTAALSVIQSMKLSPKDVVINGLPIFHVAGAIINSLSIFAAGAKLVIPTIAGYRNAEVIRQHWNIIQALNVTISSGIPTSMSSMLDVPLDRADIGSLRFLLTGGAPVPSRLHDLANERVGKNLYQAYGMTECSGVIALPNIEKPPVEGSAGEVPDSVDVRFDSGEICVRSSMVFPGYLGSDSTLTQDGWLKTGDIGYCDEAGNLFVTGRVKDLIIRSGHNIDPALIEACLQKHPSVAIAAAIGMPDEYAGELPVAYVQLSPGADTSAEELLEFARRNIAERPACPKRIIVLEELPVTTVGKIFKPKLRERITEQLLEETLAPMFGAQDITVKHNEKGQLVVDLWRVPDAKADWCRDKFSRLNLLVNLHTGSR